MKYPIRFAKYLLLERVNVGGMAEVFKAKAFGASGFQRFLAIKRILPNMSEDEEFIHMFVDEARLSVQLTHPNIVQVYELEKWENQYFIAMEYVAGKDLRRIVEWFRKRKQVMPVQLAAYICSKICDGLDFAHRHVDAQGNPINLVHRDVSPQNILVSYQGDIKVIDFGIAKAADRLSKTQAGVLKGKFGYMSPEQVAGQEIDRRSDLFAVGVLLYEMLTCQRLFVAETDFSTLEKVRQCEIPPMKERNEAIPDELEGVVRKALAKDLNERYQWCSEFMEDLQRFLIKENSTLFTGKDVAAFMKETFKEDIDAEMARMQQFATIKESDVAEPSGFTNPGTGGNTHPGRNETQSNALNHSETAIFDPNDDQASNNKTHVGDLDSVSNSSGGLRSTKRLSSSPGENDLNMRATAALDEQVVQQARNAASDTDGGSPREHTQRYNPLEHRVDAPGSASNKRVFMILGAAVTVAVLIIGIALYFRFRTVEPETTWVIFNIDPPGVPIEVYVDDEQVAKAATPIEKRKLVAGKHRLRLNPTGFQEFKGEVEFKTDQPNEITLKLKPLAAVNPPPPSTPPPQTPPATPPQAPPIAPQQQQTPPPQQQQAQQQQAPPPKKDKEPRGEKPPKKEKIVVEDAAPKSNGQPGFLMVSVPNEPGTKVIVDGKDTKRETPVVGDPIKLAPGKHVVTLAFKDGSKKQVPITVTAGLPPYKLIERK